MAQKIQTSQILVIRVRDGDELVRPFGQTLPLVPNFLLKKD